MALVDPRVERDLAHQVGDVIVLAEGAARLPVDLEKPLRRHREGKGTSVSGNVGFGHRWTFPARPQASTMSFDRLPYGVGTGGSPPESKRRPGGADRRDPVVDPELRVDPLGVLVDRLVGHLQLRRRSRPSSCRASSPAAPPPRAGTAPARSAASARRRACRARTSSPSRRPWARAVRTTSGLPPLIGHDAVRGRGAVAQALGQPVVMPRRGRSARARRGPPRWRTRSGRARR